MLKQILIATTAVIVFNAVFVFSGGLALLQQTKKQEERTVSLRPDVVDVFRYTLEEAVDKKDGRPTDGYEPYMFLAVFPGLVETDFEGVQASIGYYTIEEGRLVHKLDDTQLIHSAAKAITRDGIQTLLNNVATRTGIDLSGEGTITDIMSAITAQ